MFSLYTIIKFMKKKSLIILYFVILAVELLVTYLGNIAESSFQFFLKPFIYIALTVIVFIVLSNKYNVKKNKQLVDQVTVISMILYMLLYFASGIFFGFAHNPLKRSGVTLIYNIIYFIVPHLCIELMRYRISNNIEHEKFWKNNILFSLLFVIGMSSITPGVFASWKIILESFYTIFFPNFVVGLFMGYVGSKGSMYSCVLYVLVPVIFSIFSPLLPSPQWIVPVVLKVLTPILTYIVVDKMEKNIERIKKKIKKENIWITIGLLVAYTFVVMFACGVFRIYPVAIASNSMHPTFSRGDVEIIDKKKQPYKVGDVIQFNGLHDNTFCHRVYSVRKESGKYYYITKGDNNADVDILEVSEDNVVGKSLFTIKYFGFPTLWISEVFE